MSKPQDYYKINYGLTAPHSEVLKIPSIMKGGRVLDLGSGRGRNALFLQDAGFEVDAIDHSPKAIDTLNAIIAQEGLKGITARVAKIQDLQGTAIYDLVLSTVVLMFLPKEAIPGTLSAMQRATAPGGRNLIVSAIDCPEYPFSAHQLPFGFGFERNELANHYQHWHIDHYDEAVGHLHRLDADGNPIALRFATLVARKP